jgi:hypothetical protein
MNMTTNTLTTTQTASLAILNQTNDPAAVGGTRLGDDGQVPQNELWLFPGDRVANREISEDGSVEWSDDVAGWNYNPDTDALA